MSFRAKRGISHCLEVSPNKIPRGVYPEQGEILRFAQDDSGGLGVTGKLLFLPDGAIRNLNEREAFWNVGVVNGVAAHDPGRVRVEFDAAGF